MSNCGGAGNSCWFVERRNLGTSLGGCASGYRVGIAWVREDALVGTRDILVGITSETVLGCKGSKCVGLDNSMVDNNAGEGDGARTGRLPRSHVSR